MKFSYGLLKRLLPRIPAKTKVAERLNLHSFEVEEVSGDTLDVSLPSNRYSDAASHVGLAREVAAASGLGFRSPVRRIVNVPQNGRFIKAEIRDKRGMRYAARYFELPEKLPASSGWLADVLRACGIQVIHPLVDAMNYVMLETGQPLHVFDADRLEHEKGKPVRIVVRAARKGERLETLDGQRIVLSPKDLVIADLRRPVALAGVKGGSNSGVGSRTRRIVVEAANFDPVSVFETSRGHKLPTDAAVRFAHGLSPALVDAGLDRATELLHKMGANLLDSADVYPRPDSDRIIPFDPVRYERVIGENIPTAEARRIFTSLGFEAKPGRKKESLLVRVPAWRRDVELPEDLIEEASRIRGYNHLRPRPPVLTLSTATEDDTVILKQWLREILVPAQMDEVYNSSFLGEKDIAAVPHPAIFPRGAQAVEVRNPIAEDRKFLRPSLLPLLVRNVTDNARFFDTVRIFEMGKVFARTGAAGVSEVMAAGLALGSRKADAKLVLELKGIVDELLRGLGFTDHYFTEVPGGLRVESERRVFGELRSVEGEKGWHLALAELHADRLLEAVEGERSYEPLPKYPAVTRDISVFVSGNVRIGELLAAIQKASPDLIADTDLADEYFDEKEGRQSLTFRIVFQAEDRTLTDAEANAETDKIIAGLKQKFGAEAR